MNFTEEQVAFRDGIRRMVERHVAPIAAEIDETDRFPTELLPIYGEMGLMQLWVPEKYGGPEGNLTLMCIAREEISRVSPACGSIAGLNTMFIMPLIHFGSEEQRQRFLPRIARGELAFAIGMSEPDSGSDLASIRTRAERVEGGYKVNGTKVWTSNAHISEYMIALFRTKVVPDKKHEGLSQFLVDTKSPGISIRPIVDLSGEHHFNEVVFQDAFVPEDMRVGDEGAGWKQVTTELAFERSGPERYLSSLRLIIETIREVGAEPDARAAVTIGRLVAHLATLRQMSLSVAGMLQAGQNPNLEASVVKDVGTSFEQEIPETIHSLLGVEPRLGSGSDFERTLGFLTEHAPSFSLRGGTREVLRGIIARGLGLR